MKLHLPLCLLPLLVAAHAAEDTAVTIVNVYGEGDITSHAAESARFHMKDGAVMQGVRTTGDYQYWLGNNHVLDLKDNVSQSAGGAVSFKEHVVDYRPELDDRKEYATTFTSFRRLSICNNQVIRPQDEAEGIGSLPVEYNGGGIYGRLAGNLEITGNTAVDISGNSAECGGGIAVRSEGDSGSIHLGELSFSNNGETVFDANRASKSGGALYNTAISLTGTTGGARGKAVVHRQHGGGIRRGRLCAVHRVRQRGLPAHQEARKGDVQPQLRQKGRRRHLRRGFGRVRQG